MAGTFYGLTLLAASALLGVLWRYAVHAHHVRPDVDADEVALLSKKLTPGLAFYVVMIGLGLFFPIAAVVPRIAVFYLVPIRSFQQRSRRPG